MTIPLGTLVAITGASGSGKSTLINEILYKALWKRLVDTRTLPGEHDGDRRPRARAQGGQHRSVADRPQQPLQSGDLHRLLRHHPRSLHARRRCRSSAATSRVDSASTSRAAAARSARAKASITTQLYFMPDVEVICGACKGARFNSETLRSHAARQDDRRRAEHVGGGGRRLLREGAGDRQEDRGAERPRPRLPDARPVVDDALGRRGAAHQDRDGAEQAAARRSTPSTSSTSRRRACTSPTSSGCSSR